jgi:biopolymer transport protein ExbD
MRRFSQRHSLVTLNEINITPLLDLAFVLLIIFIIVSGSIKQEQSIDVNLPEGGKAAGQVDPKDVRSVSINQRGVFFLGNRQMSLDSLEQELIREHRANRNLVVAIRLDEMGFNKDSLALVNRLTRNGITRFRYDTKAPNRQ